MHRAMSVLARAMAIVGGSVLLALVVLMTTSIMGRVLSDVLHSDVASRIFGEGASRLLELGIGEVSGSYELLEAGIAFAIFSFFPICQIGGAHATVDVFTARLSQRTTRVIAAFWEVILTAVLLLISIQLFGGVQRYYGNGETTLFLQFPVWWAYAASFSASVVTCIVAVYCAVIRVMEAATGRPVLAQV